MKAGKILLKKLTGFIHGICGGGRLFSKVLV